MRDRSKRSEEPCSKLASQEEKLTSYGMCARLLNNGSAPVNDCLPDPQEQLHQQEDCGPHFDSRMRTTSNMFPSLPPNLQLLILAAQNAADPFNDVNTCPPAGRKGRTPLGATLTLASGRFSRPNVSEMTTFTDGKIPL